MKIGIISDIHGNSFALEKVIKYLKQNNIKKIYCLGDLVGYYPNVDEVFDLIIKNKVECILGNHDYSLIKEIPVSTNEIGIESFNLAVKKTSDENLNFLKNLKDSFVIRLKNKKVLLVHGSPWDKLEEYVFEDGIPFSKFDKINADIIIMGHTHIPFIKKYKNKIIANCGSVGQPRDSDKRASAMIFDTAKTALKIVRIKYNNEKAYEEFKKECNERVLNMLINLKTGGE